jgi:hypothetical protein
MQRTNESHYLLFISKYNIIVLRNRTLKMEFEIVILKLLGPNQFNLSLIDRIKSNLSSLNQIKSPLIESNQILPQRIKSSLTESHQKPLLPNHIKTSLTKLCQNLPHRIISKPPSPNHIKTSLTESYQNLPYRILFLIFFKIFLKERKFFQFYLFFLLNLWCR